MTTCFQPRFVASACFICCTSHVFSLGLTRQTFAIPRVSSPPAFIRYTCIHPLLFLYHSVRTCIPTSVSILHVSSVLSKTTSLCILGPLSQHAVLIEVCLSICTHVIRFIDVESLHGCIAWLLSIFFWFSQSICRHVISRSKLPCRLLH